MTQSLYDPVWLERMYNNRALVPDHMGYFDRWAQASEQARASQPCSLDVPYGDGEGEQLDVFPASTARAGGAPVMVFIHGGYWRSLDKSGHSFVAPAFTQAGACVVVVNYALCPGTPQAPVTIPHIVRQMEKALAWVGRNIAHHGGNPQCITVVGHSAGGLLAALLLTGVWPLIGADLWFTGEPAPAGTPERRRQQALEMLAAWNGEMNEHLPEPLIYAAWLRALQDRLIRDDVGPLADSFTHLEPVFVERVYRNTDGAGVWCDVIQSSPVETCSDLARIALDEALLWLVERYGPNVESWRWGDAHQAMQDHPVLGDVALLRNLVNIRQSTSGDDTRCSAA